MRQNNALYIAELFGSINFSFGIRIVRTRLLNLQNFPSIEYGCGSFFAASVSRCLLFFPLIAFFGWVILGLWSFGSHARGSVLTHSLLIQFCIIIDLLQARNHSCTHHTTIKTFCKQERASTINRREKYKAVLFFIFQRGAQLAPPFLPCSLASSMNISRTYLQPILLCWINNWVGTRHWFLFRKTNVWSVGCGEQRTRRELKSRPFVIREI